MNTTEQLNWTESFARKKNQGSLENQLIVGQIWDDPRVPNSVRKYLTMFGEQVLKQTTLMGVCPGAQEPNERIPNGRTLRNKNKWSHVGL